MKTAEQILAELDKIIAIQNSNGNWNFDAYMHGMANGLIMARSIITDEEPQFLKAPDQWLFDLPNYGMPVETEQTP